MILGTFWTCRRAQENTILESGPTKLFQIQENPDSFSFVCGDPQILEHENVGKDARRKSLRSVVYILGNPSGLRPDRRGRERFIDREHSVYQIFWKIWTLKFRA